MNLEPVVSIVIPAYNEEQRIGCSLGRIGDYFDGRGEPWELIVVDDGSTDGTAALVERFATAQPDGTARLLRHETNRGKGAAVRTGMLATRGQVALFTDADLSTPVEQFDLFARRLADGNAVVIGTRKSPEARLEKRQPRLRETLGKGFTWLSNFLVVSGVSDFTCGFKCFSRQAAQTVFKVQRLSNWSFDAEVLFLCRKHGFRIAEVPVHWADAQGTKVRLKRDIIGSLVGLLKVRYYDWKGYYDGGGRGQ